MAHPQATALKYYIKSKNFKTYSKRKKIMLNSQKSANVGEELFSFLKNLFETNLTHQKLYRLIQKCYTLLFKTIKTQK